MSVIIREDDYFKYPIVQERKKKEALWKAGINRLTNLLGSKL